MFQVIVIVFAVMVHYKSTSNGTSLPAREGSVVIGGSVVTLPLLAYNFNAITYTGDYAHIQVLTKKNHSTISKISLERQFLRKTFKRKVLKTVL